MKNINFLQENLKNIISRIHNELLLFALAIIFFTLYFPENRFIIAGSGLAFAILYSIIKITTTKPQLINPDVIPSKDWPIVKKRILENLEDDSEKLEKLIPLLEDNSHNQSIPTKHKINSPKEFLLARLNHLTLTPRSKIENEKEIKSIKYWLKQRDSINGQMSRRTRVAYIKDNKETIREALVNLIEFYK